MNKLITYILGTLIILGGIYFVIINNNFGAQNQNETRYSVSTLYAAEDSFDFDYVSMKDGKVTHPFEIKNNGTEPVLIEKVYTSCMCTTAEITNHSGEKYGEFGMPGHGIPSKTNIEIGAGESATVMAIYDPAAHGPAGVGLAQRSIYIETNSLKSPKLELSFQAMVTK